MKVGVYIACAFNPMFARLVMLQMANQTRRPDVIAVHENGLEKSFMGWSCRDIKFTGKLIHKHTPGVVRKAVRQGVALKALLETDCDYFVKADIDDFFYSTWLEHLVAAIEKEKCDWVVNRKNAVCLIKNPIFDKSIEDEAVKRHPEVHYWPSVDFGKVNPLGGMSDNIIFTRKVAEMYSKALDMMPDTADDVTLFNILPSFPGGKRIDGPLDTCYVSHGRNVSTSVWQTYVPEF